MPEKVLRTFIAIETPDEVKKIAAGIQDDLKQRFKCRVAWTKPRDIHLTLKFLGDTAVDKIEPIGRALNDTLTGFGKFKMSLSRPGTFGGRDPKVIWLGLRAPDDLQALHTYVDRVISQFGYEHERRNFHPHLTLGRIKDTHGTREMAEYIKNIEVEPLLFMVGKIVHFKSDLRPGGAAYTVLQELLLS